MELGHTLFVKFNLKTKNIEVGSIISIFKLFDICNIRWLFENIVECWDPFGEKKFQSYNIGSIWLNVLVKRGCVHVRKFYSTE